MVVNWEMFGAGMALIGATIALLALNGILATFKARVNVPWYIPLALFVIGLLILMESVGLVTSINKTIMLAVANSNLPEFVFGLVVVLFAIYEKLYERFGFKPSGWIRLAVLIFGVILILDGLRVFPVLYYMSMFIGYAIYGAAEFLAAYPWTGLFIVLAIFLVITYLYMKVREVTTARGV